ncbi:rhodanese-like domain-containing protein [Alicyclobacillus sp. SO9]|uniref:rhodanese-like domain-containing protein n=1 Tax=Alicyclobacillus sp. SO9 TaxID=2665646 RepID=UPI0018E84161|nr:rhodanese-like domain-containing protein [Alicyclobacillus sp. SO9]QQE77510.1 rhodanese-like domain-containing protein [Alicyclobacillus sp. SO9]
MQTWIWVVLVVLVVGWFLWSRRGAGGIQTIQPGELQSKLKQKPQSLHVVDVREPFEFSGGHISKAKNIPLGSLRNRLADLPKDKEIVFVCRSGNRSMKAAQIAKKAGMEAIYNLSGGMSRWSGPVKK